MEKPCWTMNAALWPYTGTTYALKAHVTVIYIEWDDVFRLFDG